MSAKKNLICLIFILEFSALECRCQIKSASMPCEKCDVTSVRAIDEDLQHVNDQQLLVFFCTFDDSCFNNAEYSEYSNEMLFKVLKAYPEKVLELLRNHVFNREYIFKQISSPIIDVDIDSLSASFRKAHGDKKVKKRILDELKTARKMTHS